jgi:hypothetical protein
MELGIFVICLCCLVQVCFFDSKIKYNEQTLAMRAFGW